MQKIVVIDKDSNTLNDISRLVSSLNMEPVVAYNVAGAFGGLNSEDIAAVFIDIESKMVNPKDILQVLKLKKTGKQIPVVFMYSNSSSKIVEEFKNYPHSAELIKPFSLEDLFDFFEKHLSLKSGDFTGMTNYDKLKNYEKFAQELEEWLEKLGSAVNG